MSAEQMITHDFDRLLAQYPAFFDQLVVYVNDIRQYGSLKQAITEAERRLETAKAAEVEFQVEMEGRHKALEADHASRKDALDAAHAARKTEVENIVTAAKLDADNIKAAGHRAKEQLVSEARAIMSTAEKRRDDATAAAEAQELLVIQKTTEVAALDDKIQAAQTELARIQQIIADTKAKLG